MGTGGEVLNYVGNGQGKVKPNIDMDLVKLFGSIPYIKLGIYMLIILIAYVVVLKIFKVKSPFKGKAVKSQLAHMEALRKREKQIVKVNRFVTGLTEAVEGSPFGLNKSYVDYWDYNVTRAGIKDPSGTRKLKATEFHAFIILGQAVVVVVSVATIIFINSMFGWVLLVFLYIMANFLPMAMLRQAVKVKDGEIRANFSDFYLMIHYVLLESTSTPLSNIMKSYDKTTTSEEMHKFIDVCLHNIDTYGEYEATRYISRHYREIPEVAKLMRLIRQSNQGGDVTMDLNGFRQELIKGKRYEITKKSDKLIKMARASFGILTVVLVQAILSAMSIYLPDLGLLTSILG